MVSVFLCASSEYEKPHSSMNGTASIVYHCSLASSDLETHFPVNILNKFPSLELMTG